MKRKFSITAALIAIIVILACALRLPKLEARPMHGDEANQAVRTGLLMEGKGYRFDPTDHHGPTLYYAALPFCRASADAFTETDEICFRAVPVTFSIFLLAALLLFPVKSARIPALALLALSPSFCFYNRFFIQETMLVLFLYGMFLSGCAWCRTFNLDAKGGRFSRTLCAISFGAFAGLSISTKETAVLSFAAAAVAALFAMYVPATRRPPVALSSVFRSAPAALLAASTVFILFYSSFFTNFQGVHDALFGTAQAYTAKAFSSPHDHPWYAYFNWLGWFKYGRGPLFGEAFILPFAAVCAVDSFAKGRRMGIFISLYTVVLTVIYSSIPYKTPWCALSFLFGAIVMAADGIGILWHRFGSMLRVVLGVVFSALLLWHGVQAYRACFKYDADVRNPYVYAHTGNDCLLLVEKVRSLLLVLPEKDDAMVAIAAPSSDYWPLPWYLRKCRNLGCWNSVAEIPPEVKPQILISAAADGERAAALMGSDAEIGFFGVRPGVLVQLFAVRKEK